MKRYKEQCQKISEQIEPSEEFMKNLKTNLNKKIEERTIKHKYQLSKVAVVFFAVTLVSTGAFGKDIGSWMSKIFRNSDPSTQVAIEHGYIQNVGGEYVENQGIGIKVNSLVIDDNKMNIVFDIKGEIEGEILIKDIFLYDYTTNSIYDFESLIELNVSYETFFNSINAENHTLILNLSNLNNSFKNTNRLKISLNQLYNIKEDKLIDGIWEFENIQVDNNIFKLGENSKEIYVIQKNDNLDSYKINSTTTGLNIQLKLKDEFDKYELINKGKITIEAENDKKYECKDFCKITNNTIEMNIPITIYDNINNFNIILELEDKKIILDIQREES